jgi:UPF0716 family protein affecting phage T7 exclusion
MLGEPGDRFHVEVVGRFVQDDQVVVPQQQAGQVPAGAVFDGALILVAGAMLMTPGLITDALGFLLLIPTTRNWFKYRAMEWAKRNVTISSHTSDGFYRSATHSEVIESHVVDREGRIVEEDSAR